MNPDTVRIRVGVRWNCKPEISNALDSDDATQNIPRINPDQDGLYTLWLGSRRSEGGEYFVDLEWHSAVGCSDPYSA